MGTSSIAGLLVIIIIITDCTESKIIPEDAEKIFFRINFTNIVPEDAYGYSQWDMPAPHIVLNAFLPTEIDQSLLESIYYGNLLRATVRKSPFSSNSRFKRLLVLKATSSALNYTYYFRKDPERFLMFMFEAFDYPTDDMGLYLYVVGYVPIPEY